ncbi:MAG: glycosyltransferase family 2 protein, partial [Nitrospirae bacterium]|nr:glycosyltransferase family 2 protein [Nitrospirota bacterium]
MKLSIVTTLYYSEPYIAEFYERISTAAQRITDDYELILVNDGSPDESLSAALALYEKDKRVIVIDFAKNFGHHKAIMTGLSYAQGDYVFLIDSDLEEQPENLDLFWNELHAAPNIDVVYGTQYKRKGGWFEKITGNIFYKLFNI